MGLFSFLFGKNNKKELAQEALKQGALLIDVRTPGEFKQGHAKGSVNIPLNTFENKIKTLKTKDQPVILVCRLGNRAESARSMLKSRGIEAINMGAWQAVRGMK